MRKVQEIQTREVGEWVDNNCVKNHCRVYAIYVRSSMVYGSQTMPLLADVGLNFERAEMQMIIWMCGVSIRQKECI